MPGLTPKKITAKNFSRYGRIIEYARKSNETAKRNLFRIILREKGCHGWRIAYLVVRDRRIDRLEQHPHTFESFEPVKGQSILYLAVRKGAPIEGFYLDKPVVLKKGVWHGVVSTGRESEIKITENSKVNSIYWRLRFSLNHTYEKNAI